MMVGRVVSRVTGVGIASVPEVSHFSDKVTTGQESGIRVDIKLVIIMGLE
jgi:hypothetical protein